MTAPPEPDIEDFIVAYLTNGSMTPIAISPLGLPAASITARIAADPMPLPSALVTRVAGGNDYVWDYPTVDIDWFAASQTAAQDLGWEGHNMMRQLNPKTVVNVNGVDRVVSHIEYPQAPYWSDYQDPIVMRYKSQYILTQRLPSITGF